MQQLKARLSNPRRASDLRDQIFEKAINNRDFIQNLYQALKDENAKIQPIAVTINKKTKLSTSYLINLNKDGEFIEEWPDGFFDERFVELGIL